MDYRLDLGQARRSHPKLDSTLRRISDLDKALYLKISEPRILRRLVQKAERSFEGKTTLAELRELIRTDPDCREGYELTLAESERRGVPYDRADIIAVAMVGYAKYFPGVSKKLLELI